MRFVVNIDTDEVADPRVVAAMCRGFLKGVIAQNRVLIRNAKAQGRPYPKLYESGVVYGREPSPEDFQELADLRTVLDRGWGDCKHLVAWLCAERNEEGEQCTPVIYWRLRNGRPYMWHAEARLHKHSINRRCTSGCRRTEREDPSRFLGM